MSENINNICDSQRNVSEQVINLMWDNKRIPSADVSMPQRNT